VFGGKGRPKDQNLAMLYDQVEAFHSDNTQSKLERGADFVPFACFVFSFFFRFFFFFFCNKTFLMMPLFATCVFSFSTLTLRCVCLQGQDVVRAQDDQSHCAGVWHCQSAVTIQCDLCDYSLDFDNVAHSHDDLIDDDQQCIIDDDQQCIIDGARAIEP
jgi:hypothetical protein